MDLNSLLGTLASASNANKIGQKFNIDSNKVSSVISNALPTLIGAMQKNAATESGASSLAKAMTDHIGDSIFNLGKVDMNDGNKILGHILGNNTNSVISALAQKTGTDKLQVGNILAAIAPALLGLLGKGQQGSNAGSGGLGSLLGGILGGGNNRGGGLGSILGGAMGDKNNNGIPDIMEGFLK